MKKCFTITLLGVSLLVLSGLSDSATAKPRTNGCTANQVQSNQPGIRACAERMERDLLSGGGAHTELVCVGDQVNCCSNDKNGNTRCTFAGTASPRIGVQPGQLNHPQVRSRGIDGGQNTKSSTAGESPTK